MLKVKDIIGKPVVASDSGERIETVIAPIFDRAENCLLGFLVDQAGWFSNPKVLPLYLVQTIEADAVIIPWKESIAPASDYATIHDVLEQNNSLNSDQMLTNEDLDLYFDENTGDIENSEATALHL
ncbi:PRC-barrel domain-containing protein [Chamaesiphon sp. VAR_48_metabat_135_sub]|uniref:PRC-barrel domain-containing protein n=1 Tax=Chamaesiphon sp. VAR_48_metabat_135_sub TaxID=2964699 RepID=UPI00286BC563|nr:PRC-barrel domain-containing protein [Chamaesiphon sp. VAR_48_metabat_135_sub]